jgi:thiamine biosynthesis lipoprotein
MVTHQFQALGTVFSISIWDDGFSRDLSALFARCEQIAHEFDSCYSRFQSDSLVSRLATTTGTHTVPEDFVVMLAMYEALYRETDGKMNPCIGHTLSDLGYDATYRLTPRETVRPTIPFQDALTILDENHVTLHQPVLLDMGALGKGYLVDLLTTMLTTAGCTRCLVNGSGDIRYVDTIKTPIVCGLEDPYNPERVLGTVSLSEGALCASATNRRAWGAYHHYIDPHTHMSTDTMVATWVIAPTAAWADALSSALFFISPQALSHYTFEYLTLNKDGLMQKSAGFPADVFLAE